MDEKARNTKISEALQLDNFLSDMENIFSNGTLDEIKEFILKHKLKDMRFPNGKNFLHYLASNKDMQVLSYFVEQANTNELNAPTTNGWTPLLIAANRKNIPAVIFFLTKGADPYKVKGKDVIELLKIEGVSNETLKSIQFLISSHLNSHAISIFSLSKAPQDPERELQNISASTPLLENLRYPQKQKKE